MALWIVIGVVVVAVWLFLLWGARPIARSREEVIAVLESAFLTQGDDLWDDFVSIRIQDAQLEAIRKKCADLQFEPQEVWEAGLREMLAELKDEPAQD